MTALIRTFRGELFDLADPRPEMVDCLDIAHALSHLCRYGGHTKRFYSVAEHCVLMSYAVAPEHALHALLHDATEAYVGDVVKPLKALLPAYQEIEQAIWLAIAARFGIDPAIPDEVHDADRRIFVDEKRVRNGSPERPGEARLGVAVAGWPAQVAKARYLYALRRHGVDL